MIDSDSIDRTVCSCKVNIFKNTSRTFFFRQRHTHVRRHAMLCNTYDLTRKDISYKLCPDCCDRTAFRCQKIRIVPFSDTEWFQSKRIPCPDHLSRTADHQRIGSFDLLHSIFYCIFCLRNIQTLSCHMISNNL